jgi:putative transposase
MKKSRFTEALTAFALRQAESGTPVAEIIRKLGIAEQTFLPLEEEVRGDGGRGAAAFETARGWKPAV